MILCENFTHWSLKDDERKSENFVLLVRYRKDILRKVDFSCSNKSLKELSKGPETIVFQSNSVQFPRFMIKLW